MSEELSVDKTLTQLWRRGIYRGEAARLAALANSSERRGPELRAFAQLAALIEGTPLETQQARVSQTSSVAVLALAAQAWSAAAGGQLQDSDLHLAAMDREVKSLQETSESEERKAATGAWADYAAAECAYLAGASYTCRVHINKVLENPKCPKGLVLQATIRMAFLEGMAKPDAAARHMDAAVRLAERAGSLHDRVYSLTYAALFSMLRGSLADAKKRFERVVREGDTGVPQSYCVLSRLFLACITGPDSLTDANAHIAEGIRCAAQSGDYVCYVLLIIMGARLYMAMGSAADAIATLSNGIAQLKHARGTSAAAPLIAERENLHEHVGEHEYSLAIQKIIEDMQ